MMNNAADAASMAVIRGDQINYFNFGKNIAGNDVDEHTIYEGASLSKTVLTFIFFKTMRAQINQNLQELPISDGQWKTFFASHELDSIHWSSFYQITLSDLLTHTSGIAQIIKNEMPIYRFEYSDFGYLLLQFIYETLHQKPFTMAIDSILSNDFHFVWQPNPELNFVNSFTKKYRPERNIRNYEQPLANGTLLCSTSGLVKFCQLLTADFFDFITEKKVLMDTTNPDFRYLYWGQGMGIEILNDRKFFWQWGNNYCYNSAIIIEPKSNTSYLLLTNTLSARMAFMPILREMLGNEAFMCLYYPW
jgi:hypothetical protein